MDHSSSCKPRQRRAVLSTRSFHLGAVIHYYERERETWLISGCLDYMNPFRAC